MILRSSAKERVSRLNWWAPLHIEGVFVSRRRFWAGGCDVDQIAVNYLREARLLAGKPFTQQARNVCRDFWHK